MRHAAVNSCLYMRCGELELSVNRPTEPRRRSPAAILEVCYSNAVCMHACMLDPPPRDIGCGFTASTPARLHRFCCVSQQHYNATREVALRAAEPGTLTTLRWALSEIRQQWLQRRHTPGYRVCALALVTAFTRSEYRPASAMPRRAAGLAGWQLH